MTMHRDLPEAVEELRGRVERLEEVLSTPPATEADRVALLDKAARVAELESERDDALEQVAELERASLKAEQKAAAEPVAWGIQWGGEEKLDVDNVYLRHDWAKDHVEYVGDGGTVVPLYTAPPPAAGWLTGEERSAIKEAVATIRQCGIDCRDLGPDFDGAEYDEIAAALDAIILRDAPPKVVTPKGHGGPKLDTETTIQRRDRQWIAALAAAGVECKR